MRHNCHYDFAVGQSFLPHEIRRCLHEAVRLSETSEDRVWKKTLSHGKVVMAIMSHSFNSGEKKDEFVYSRSASLSTAAMWERAGVPQVLCSPVAQFPRVYVPQCRSSPLPAVPLSDVPQCRCSPGSMFPRRCRCSPGELQ